MSPLDFENCLERVRAVLRQMNAAISETHETADRAKEIADRSDAMSVRIVSR